MRSVDATNHPEREPDRGGGGSASLSAPDDPDESLHLVLSDASGRRKRVAVPLREGRFSGKVRQLATGQSCVTIVFETRTGRSLGALSVPRPPDAGRGAAVVVDFERLGPRRVRVRAEPEHEVGDVVEVELSW